MRGEDDWREYVERLGTRLHRGRMRLGLSQEAVAYRAGLSRFTYQGYEKGRSQTGAPANPSLRAVMALAQVLCIPVEDLLPDKPPSLTH